jgi:hypothetical protein
LTGILVLGTGPSKQVMFEYMHVDSVCHILRKLGDTDATCGNAINIFFINFTKHNLILADIFSKNKLTHFKHFLTAAGVDVINMTDWWNLIHRQIDEFQKATILEEAKIKALEGLLLFKDGLPSDDKWINNAKVQPNFTDFLGESYTYSAANVKLYLDFIQCNIKSFQ